MSALLPALVEPQAWPNGLAPLLPHVTAETLAHVAEFAARDRLCLTKTADRYDAIDAYKSCLDGLRSTTYCHAEAADIADLQALIDSDPRLGALVASAEPVIDYIAARCEKQWPAPSRELLAASSRAVLDRCHMVMPVLIAHAITLSRSDRESSERHGLCRWSLGKDFIRRNCAELVRYARRAGPPPRAPAPYALGIEPYFCPEEFLKVP
jgi:hypothetical protein